MSRSGYSDDCDGLALYRGTVFRIIKGKRGRAFLIELAEAMDAMPVKELIADELVQDGRPCALGVVGMKRGIDMQKLDVTDARQIGATFGIPWQLAAEIEFYNDEVERWDRYEGGKLIAETPSARWTRMRAWVQKQIDNPVYE